MIVDFDKLSDKAKVWIFKGERKLNKEEIDSSRKGIDSFFAQWLSHGENVNGGAKFINDQILVVGAETSEGNPSGCSTDTLIKFVGELSSFLKVDLRDSASFLVEGEDGFDRVDFRQINEKISSGEITEESKMVNSLIQKKGDLEANFLLPASKILGGRYFETVNE